MANQKKNNNETPKTMNLVVNGQSYIGVPEYVANLINQALAPYIAPAKPETPVEKLEALVAAQAKPETKQSTTAKQSKGAKVLRVDKYGNQWIAEYDEKIYKAAKAKAIADGTYDSKNRSAIYKALGWIL